MPEQKLVVPACPRRENGHLWRFDRERSTAWSSAAGRLSCELEGHPLGGGMLKLEPGEARNVLLTPDKGINGRDGELLQEGIDVMRQWRHVA